jgi:hypothetical protein
VSRAYNTYITLARWRLPYSTKGECAEMTSLCIYVNGCPRKWLIFINNG